MKSRDTVRVAYLGGSITAQPGWRVYSLNWFKENYPDTKFVEINAAIGGTGSSFGAYRVKDQVLQYKPDLVFVEFAVNDASADPNEITRSMEGIVRQIWEQNLETDICFIYTIKEDFIDSYKRNSTPISVETMEKIAEYYQIPSINFGPEVLKRIGEGKLLFKGKAEANDVMVVFSPDGVHPYPESGHKIYYDVFKSALTELKSKVDNKVIKHKNAKPLDANLYLNTKMVDWKKIDLKQELTSIDTKSDTVFSGFTRYFNSIGKGLPGDSLSFQFRGKAIGYYDLMGPSAGTVEVSVDGKKQNHTRFDGYCTYWRISFKTINGLTDSIHTVTFKVLDKHIDKNEILSANNRSMKRPEDFAGLNWYLAKILLDGDLIEKQD